MFIFICSLYALFTFILFKSRIEIKFHSLLFLFIAYTFITYGVASVVLDSNPELSFVFKGMPWLSYHDDIAPFYQKSFYVFLAGYISFIAGYLLVGKKKVNIQLNTSLQFNDTLLVIGFLVANWGSYYFRFHFHAGIPMYIAATHKFANYLWYSLNYLSLILLVIVAYRSLLSTKSKDFWIGIFCGLNYGVSLLMLGWKSGIIWALLIFIHAYLFIKREVPPHEAKANIKKTKNFAISFTIIILLILFSFRLIPKYRDYTQTIQKNKQPFQISELLSLTKTAFSSKMDSGDQKNFGVALFNRLTGINALTPIIAMEKSPTENPLSLWGNILKRGSQQPEIYYADKILQIPPSKDAALTTFAPTGVGVFYLYSGVIGVISAFFVIGLLSALFENTVITLTKQSLEFSALYTIVFVIIFPSVVFEGTVFFFLKRHFGSLILVFLLFRLIMASMKKRRIAFF